MKTTVEQRAELRRLADKHSLLKWPELIDLLDDFDTLKAERDRQYEFNAGQIAKIAKLEAEREQMLEALSKYEEQVQKLEAIVEDI